MAQAERMHKAESPPILLGCGCGFGNTPPCLLEQSDEKWLYTYYPILISMLWIFITYKMWQLEKRLPENPMLGTPTPSSKTVVLGKDEPSNEEGQRKLQDEDRNERQQPFEVILLEEGETKTDHNGTKTHSEIEEVGKQSSPSKTLTSYPASSKNDIALSLAAGFVQILLADRWTTIATRTLAVNTSGFYGMATLMMFVGILVLTAFVSIDEKWDAACLGHRVSRPYEGRADWSGSVAICAIACVLVQWVRFVWSIL